MCIVYLLENKITTTTTTTTTTTWSLSELIRIWLYSVDFPHFDVPLT